MSLKGQAIHPFPARMAPEVALGALDQMPEGARVLDPMAGSGTVLRAASEAGLESYGCDVDPLAILVASVWSSGVQPHLVVDAAVKAAEDAKRLQQGVFLDWIDRDPETQEFIAFWFAKEQVRDLRCLASVLIGMRGPIADALRVALSRTIITKERGASLGRDVSHSRPHRVRLENDFAVLDEFLVSAKRLAAKLGSASVRRPSRVELGDARRLRFRTASFDAVVTSPPYLNAIDYLRGHKLALVWLGHSIAELRSIRGGSIGSERGSPELRPEETWLLSRPWFEQLSPRYQRMVAKYSADIDSVVGEIARVLRPAGRAVFVIGNSCVHGVYVENSSILEKACERVGLSCVEAYSRELPPNRRYLPIPERRLNEDLAKRMRHEIVLRFERVS